MTRLTLRLIKAASPVELKDTDGLLHIIMREANFLESRLDESIKG